MDYTLAQLEKLFPCATALQIMAAAQILTDKAGVYVFVDTPVATIYQVNPVVVKPESSEEAM